MRSEARFVRRHAILALLAFAVPAVLVLLLTRSPAYAGGVVLGPFAGGVAREWQSCCAANSLGLAPFSIAGLLGGLALQLALPPGRAWLALVRWIGWSLGCLCWFGGALVSYGHALE